MPQAASRLTSRTAGCCDRPGHRRTGRGLSSGRRERPAAAVSFAVILAGALLFTNAVEWIGHRLKLGEGAVGSLLAAVGTAMPETLIAIVALIGANEGADQVAIGAIVGAPFLLGTLAMGLVGLFAYLYRERREQGLELNAHGPTLERDLRLLPALLRGLAWRSPGARRTPLRIPVGILVILAYVFYIRRTLRGGRRGAGPRRRSTR